MIVSLAGAILFIAIMPTILLIDVINTPDELRDQIITTYNIIENTTNEITYL